MRLARFSDGGAPFWGVVDPAADIDAAPSKALIRPFHGAFAQWAPAVTRGEGEAALRFTGPARRWSDLRVLPPIEKINRIVVAGANYRRHLAEFGLAAPSQPIAFLKAYGALIGADDAIRYPPLTRELDYEVELVVVIGADHIDHQDPLSSVLGYTVGNDVSARDLQRSGPPGIGMDLFAAKSQDRTTGLGPWIVTRDEFPAGSPKLGLQLLVNGVVRQDGNTAEMSWDVPALLRFVDQRSRFDGGDILFTGTPEGVAQSTGQYLRPGDIVEARIDGIGRLRNRVEGILEADNLQ